MYDAFQTEKLIDLWPADVKAWVHGALAEHDFRDFEEPFRLQR